MIGKKYKTNGSSFVDKWLIKTIIAVAVILFVVSSIIWWRQIRNNPENIFRSVINNNLRTASVTRTTAQESGAQKLKQIMRIQNRTQHVTNGKTILSQGKGTVVITESIGTPNTEYIRYVSIDTDQKNSKGQGLSFDGVLGLWAENNPEENKLSSLYQDVTIGGFFLFADLDAQSRQTLVNKIFDNGVYDVDYATSKRFNVSGRPKMSYKIKLNLKQYITSIQEYGKMVGISQFDEIDPNAYEGAEPIAMSVVVDVLTQRIDAVKTDDGSTDQTYNGYGIIENINIPQNAMPASELQEKLTEKASA